LRQDGHDLRGWNRYVKDGVGWRETHSFFDRVEGVRDAFFRLRRESLSVERFWDVEARLPPLPADSAFRYFPFASHSFVARFEPLRLDNFVVQGCRSESLCPVPVRLQPSF
jgi:hypothetical protein